MDGKKILIIGAGIAGLSMYRALAKNNIDATIIEKKQQQTKEGAGIALPANAIAGFEKIGLKNSILKQAHQVNKITFAKHTGKKLSTKSLLKPPFNQQPFVALRRSKLIDILQKGITKHVQYGITATEFAYNGKQTKVTFSNGQKEFFDIIIAADGMNSDIRKHIDENAEPEDLGYINWRFIVDMDTINIEPIYFVGKDELFMIYPIAKNEVYCYAHIRDEQRQQEPPTLDRLKEIFKCYAQPVQQALKKIQPDELIIGRLKSVAIGKVYDKNIVLIGDALHGCPPSLQQGVGQSLEDVITLAECLKDSGIKDALALYKEKRLPRINWVVGESKRIIQLASKGKHLLGRVVRNLLIRKNGPVNVAGWKKLLQEDL